MYTTDYIDYLNEFGVLTSAMLARKFKLEPKHARKILHCIVEDYENVKARTPDQIYIEGRELDQWIPKPKKIKANILKTKKPKKVRLLKRQKWKDVTGL
jgi:hypothetical protein